MRRGLVIAAGWAAAVVAAAVAGVASIDTLAGTDHGGPLTAQQVADRLAHASQESTRSGATQPAPVRSPSSGASPARQYYTTSGGSLWVSCTGDAATLDTVAPRSGYRIDGSQAGPAQAAWVRFKAEVDHGHASEYLVTVTCPDGLPHMAETADN